MRVQVDKQQQKDEWNFLKKHFYSHYFQSCYLEWEGFYILNAVLKTTVMVLITYLD